MARSVLYHFEPKVVRDYLRAAERKAVDLRVHELELVALLAVIDRNRFYIRAGFTSLTGYCVRVLKISRTQTQRLVTLVRRIEFDSGLEAPSDLSTSLDLLPESACRHGAHSDSSD